MRPPNFKPSLKFAGQYRRGTLDQSNSCMTPKKLQGELAKARQRRPVKTSPTWNPTSAGEIPALRSANVWGLVRLHFSYLSYEMMNRRSQQCASFWAEGGANATLGIVAQDCIQRPAARRRTANRRRVSQMALCAADPQNKSDGPNTTRIASACSGRSF